MNKAELIEAVEERLQCDRKTAQAAVDHMVDVIVRSVAKGEKVAISSFGVFEKRRRRARTARNPATGASVKVKATSVPAFRPGAGFKEVVSGTRKLERVAKAPAKRTAKATAAAGASAAKQTAAARKTAATKAPAAKRTTAKAAEKTTPAKATKRAAK